MQALRGGIAGLIFWLALVVPGLSQTAIVKSGEHEGFTRLVLTLPQPASWRMGRTDDGYAVSFDGPALRFDLSEVFRLIPRRRLAAIWADPETGNLRLGLACRCHAQAFEFRRGIIVIDLRDGPPPADSPFETGPDGMQAAAAPPRPVVRPRARPAALVTMPDAPRYDWLPSAMATAQGSGAGPEAAADVPGDLPGTPLTDSARLAAEDWRDGLLAEIARAAARGTVEITAPRAPKPPSPAPADLAQIQIGAAPVRGRGPGENGPGQMTAEGRACLSDPVLALAEWGDPRPVAVAMGLRTGSLFGEFDKPMADAMSVAVRYLLSIGFGAEARQLIQIAGDDLADAAVLRAMSYILDGDPLPSDETALAGMTGCDSAAALWSVLALPSSHGAGRAREAAILGAFSALPLHLRRHLGPVLADRLIADGKADTARAVRDAILRAPGEAGPAVRLMSLGIDEAAGQPAPETDLTELRAAQGSTGLRATIWSLDREVAAERVPEPALILSGEAMLQEFASTAEAQELARSLAAAQAMAGDFFRAFALASGDAGAEAQVWSILGRWGSTAAVLTHALGHPDDLPDHLTPAADRALAARLIALGFPREALAWIEPTRRKSMEPDPEDLLLRAEALLADRDARGALRAVAGLDLPAAQPLRDRALLALGGPLADDPEAKQGPDADILARRNAQWAFVAELGPSPWREAAALVDGDTEADLGVLARSRQLRAQSEAARARVIDLLAQTRIPATR